MVTPPWYHINDFGPLSYSPDFRLSSAFFCLSLLHHHPKEQAPEISPPHVQYLLEVDHGISVRWHVFSHVSAIVTGVWSSRWVQFKCNCYTQGLVVSNIQSSAQVDSVTYAVYRQGLLLGSEGPSIYLRRCIEVSQEELAFLFSVFGQKTEYVPTSPGWNASMMLGTLWPDICIILYQQVE